MLEIVEWYNTHADEYFSKTKDYDISHIREKFEVLLPEKAVILDAGCGPGRDVKYFHDKGYSVDAFDASEELVKIGVQHSGSPIALMSFADFDLTEKYDGIWACTSLVHMQKEELLETISRLFRGLKKGGIFYTTLKRSDGEPVQDSVYDGRYFIRVSEDYIRRIFTGFDCEVLEVWAYGVFWNILVRKN